MKHYIKLKEIYFTCCLFTIISCKRDNGLLEVDNAIKDINYSKIEMKLIREKVQFPMIAYGRESSMGANDRPYIYLTDNGFAHPSILHIPEGFSGYKFWAGITPHFGIIGQQKDHTAFENPHIFASNDGITWKEISNGPIDLPAAGPFISYWSDNNLVYDNDKLYVYYRSSGFPINYFGDKLYHLRASVLKESSDGINWSQRKFLYGTKNTVGIDDNSMILSPSVVKDNGIWFYYDVIYSTDKNPYPPVGNQTNAFVVRRLGDTPYHFEAYSQDKICEFINRPWGKENDPWHIEVIKANNKFYMLICVGKIGKSHGDSLWLAHSDDGKTFTVIEQSLFNSNTYKSGFYMSENNDDDIKFRIYRSEKNTGYIHLYELKLSKK
ncbi:hypothetical protein D1Z98_00220 [Riemerella anatipestifer]|uniref:hypothetical protein n=1 Tax=Riemerella anatipestifer TaxID=34085 RepID=UPI00129E6FE8|nr:hypothetical protein [Riemerella anatipestifer]MRM93454.1 hypothetical protein [Riemerella anatipestifer]